MSKRENLRQKIIILIFITILFSFISSFDFIAYAKENKDILFVNKGEVLIAIDGKPVSIPKEYGVPFVDENDRTMIPIRIVTEELGHKVRWNKNERVVTIDNSENGNKVAIKIGDNVLKYQVNGEIKQVKMDTTAIIKDGRTYVPARFPLEALGHKVEWARAEGGGHYVNILINQGTGLDGEDVEKPDEKPKEGEVVFTSEDGSGSLTLLKDEFPEDYPELDFKIYTYAGEFKVVITNPEVMKGYKTNAQSRFMAPWNAGDKNWNENVMKMGNMEATYKWDDEKNVLYVTDYDLPEVTVARKNMRQNGKFSLESGNELITPKQFEPVSIEIFLEFNGKERIYRLDSVYNKDHTWNGLP